MIITILSSLLGLTILFLILTILHLNRVQKVLTTIDKEQHIQNKELIQLMKANTQHVEMLMQHIEILKYLIEQDPMLSKIRIPYGGVVGEA